MLVEEQTINWDWETDYDAALKRAHEEKRQVFVYFHKPN
jgi:hypothetical protein